MQGVQGQEPKRRGREPKLDVESERSVEQRIEACEVARRIRSFDHFAYVWGTKAGYYIPPHSSLTWHFISQVLAGEKKLLRAADVGFPFKVPKFKGQLAQDHWNKFKGIGDLRLYFPDISEGLTVPREYFYNVS